MWKIRLGIYSAKCFDDFFRWPQFIKFPWSAWSFNFGAYFQYDARVYMAVYYCWLALLWEDGQDQQMKSHILNNQGHCTSAFCSHQTLCPLCFILDTDDQSIDDVDMFFFSL